MPRPVLVLTGGPAVGKSTTARTLATARDRAAFVDVDDVRQLVVAGGAAPWQGAEGEAQALLGVHNACDLAGRFRSAGFDVVIADVLSAATAAVYRARLPGCVLVRVYVSRAEAHRRAATRRVWLTPDEFELLHDRDRDDPPEADHHLFADGHTVSSQAAAVEALWSAAPDPAGTG